jgi:hypothetical protein
VAAPDDVANADAAVEAPLLVLLQPTITMMTRARRQRQHSASLK